MGQLRRGGPDKMTPMKIGLEGWRLLEAGELVLDREGQTAALAGRRLALSPRALAVLEHLMRHPGQIVTRPQLLAALGGRARSRAFDVRIAELRRALGDDRAHPRYIQTASGEGYSFVANVRGRD